MDKAFDRAIRNVISYGDTDIFPYPFENTLFNQKKEDTKKLLSEIHENFQDYLANYPPEHENLLVPVGYTGFRWATQMDPFWNLYFLALVISIGDKIESARIPSEWNCIYSYRFVNNDADNLFNIDIGWKDFLQRSKELADNHQYVLICDIADFYQRINHHSLENALKQSAKDSHVIPQIMHFLQNYSNTKSYSLPVGGPAARLLSELVLNKTDRLLYSHGITFCRFADDYHIFANDKNELYKTLVYLSEKLILNEGLTIQKSKTRILSSSEFKATTRGLGIDEHTESEMESEASQLFKMSLRFDPYSPTAEQDYEELKNQVQRFDIIGILQSELRKTHVHSAIVRKLIQTLKYLDDNQKNDATLTLIDNIDLLFPIFSTVLTAIYTIYDDLYEEVKQNVQTYIRQMITEEHYAFNLDIHKAYAVRIFSKSYNNENEALLSSLFKTTESEMIKRDIILTMAKWGNYFWISDLRNRFRSLNGTGRRAFIIASYRLTDEGKHWRDHTKRQFSPFESLTRSWACNLVDHNTWNMPL